MSEQKKQLSKLCLAGFILSVLAPILLILTLNFRRRLDSGLYGILCIVIVLMPIAGLVLSIVGVVTASKKRRKGKGLGIAGIVLPNVYIVITILMWGIFGLLIVLSGSKNNKKSDLDSMWGVGSYANTEFDVSQYRLMEKDIDSLDMSVNRDELKEYANSRLGSITDESRQSIRGKYGNYDFFIIRSDYFEEWLEEDSIGSNLNYYPDGYAQINYTVTWEFSAGAIYTLDVYKDPSDKFIIITNCSDYRVITYFFERNGTSSEG